MEETIEDLQREAQRDSILLNIRRGTRLPQELEPLFLAQWKEPLLHQVDRRRINVMELQRWSFAMAVAWVAWRTREAVEVCCAPLMSTGEKWRPFFGRDGSQVGWAPGPISEKTALELIQGTTTSDPDIASLGRAVVAPDQAEVQLRDALCEGRIEAAGYDVRHKARDYMSRRFWLNAKRGPSAAMDCFLMRDSDGYHLFTTMEVPRAGLMVLFPAIEFETLAAPEGLNEDRIVTAHGRGAPLWPWWDQYEKFLWSQLDDYGSAWAPDLPDWSTKADVRSAMDAWAKDWCSKNGMKPPGRTQSDRHIASTVRRWQQARADRTK